MRAGSIANINVGILYLLAISSLGVYGVIMGGWASNSKYPFLVALRAAAQMVSYEVSIGFVIVAVLLCVGSLNISDIVQSQQTGSAPCSACPAPSSTGTGCRCSRCSSIFFISALAETNRPPFDLVGSGIGAGRRLHGRNIPRRLTCCSCSANTPPSCLMCAHDVPSCSSAAGCRPSISRRSPGCPGIIWFVLKVVLRLLHVRHGEGHRAALPLRPADAPRLEGVPAALARLGRGRRRLASVRSTE